MIRDVRYDSPAVLDFLQTNPHAEELRTLIECVRRGQVPHAAVVGVDARGLTMYQLEDCGRHVWWHYEENRTVLVFDGIA